MYIYITYTVSHMIWIVMLQKIVATHFKVWLTAMVSTAPSPPGLALNQGREPIRGYTLW